MEIVVCEQTINAPPNARATVRCDMALQAPTQSSDNIVKRIGAWLDQLPNIVEIDAREQLAQLPDAPARLAQAATYRTRPPRSEARRDYDALQFDLWANSVLDLGLTDIVIPINEGHEHSFAANPYLADDSWRRLNFLTNAFTQHRYPNGFPRSPSVHIMAFCGIDQGFIATCSAGLIDACANAQTISSVMLDCEEWWVGGAGHSRPLPMRERAASDVKTYLWDAWPPTQRPAGGIGVTGLASKPPVELLQFLDYGVPQIYGSMRNMGGPSLANAACAHRRFYRRWFDAFNCSRPANERHIIVGHTANGTYVDSRRIRMLMEATLGLGGSGAPPLNPPNAIYYWSVTHINRSHTRRNEVKRLTSLARNGGIDLRNVQP
ncbi:hypothetical protein WMF20_27215 [Sorangium sp. So ce834]|uniref:hypothetical protein n=1 Tax=Sorangium sp. So ce834 TaxID=3133321 RepID=UPI003F617433